MVGSSLADFTFCVGIEFLLKKISFFSLAIPIFGVCVTAKEGHEQGAAGKLVLGSPERGEFTRGVWQLRVQFLLVSSSLSSFYFLSFFSSLPSRENAPFVQLHAHLSKVIFGILFCGLCVSSRREIAVIATVHFFFNMVQLEWDDLFLPFCCSNYTCVHIPVLHTLHTLHKTFPNAVRLKLALWVQGQARCWCKGRIEKSEGVTSLHFIILYPFPTSSAFSASPRFWLSNVPSLSNTSSVPTCWCGVPALIPVTRTTKSGHFVNNENAHIPFSFLIGITLDNTQARLPIAGFWCPASIA